jgi:GT2 family glycosyltransferase
VVVCQDEVVEAYDVTIVTHHHADVVGACLRAVARLDPPPHSVTVFDNASADGSAAAAAASSLPGLRIVRSDRNLGFAAALNRLIAATPSPWLLSLNPDCAPRPDFARRLLEAIGSDSRVGAATGKLLRADGPELEEGPTVDAAGMVVTPSGRHFDRGSGDPDDGRFDRQVAVFGGTGAATIYRRAALDDVAYPDDEVFAESFFAYREDAELAWRLQWRGWSARYVPTAVAAHRRGLRPETGRRQSDDVNRYSVRNRFLLRLHCADLRWHLVCLPWWLVRDLAVVAACLTVERSSLPGLADVVRVREDARRRRAWVLGRRTVPSRHISRWFRTGGRVEELDTT